jgi:hypothetical protein
MSPKSIRAAVVATLLLAAGAYGSLGAEQATDDWLRGSGKDLQICLKGEVFDSDGEAARSLTFGVFLEETNSPEIGFP